jgi:hypothetical protein
MNIEFHYYIMYLLAHEAGLPDDEAGTIAYSSQLVDGCVIPYTVDTGNELYEVRATQNYAFWDDATCRDIYLPFHFVPAGIEPGAGSPPSNRADGTLNAYNTVAGSAAAKALLVAALKTRDPYRVGIGLHAYADTWAHQNFTGFNEPWNIVDARLPLPPAGHAQALRSPDGLAESWADPRLLPAESKVANRVRFLGAARMIYKYLCTYNRKGFDDADWVLERLEEYWGPRGRERERRERQIEYVLAAGMSEFDRLEWFHEAGIYEDGEQNEALFSGYDKLVWLKNELKNLIKLYSRKPIALGRQFYKTRLYRFCEAAAAHRAEAAKIRRAAGLAV